MKLDLFLFLYFNILHFISKLIFSSTPVKIVQITMKIEICKNFNLRVYIKTIFVYSFEVFIQRKIYSCLFCSLLRIRMIASVYACLVFDFMLKRFNRFCINFV